MLPESSVKMDDRQKILIEYLRRSYFAVDGLWFMKKEEESSFAEALEMDKKVWQILARIQARKTKELLSIEEDTLGALFTGLQVKFEAEQYDCELTTLDEHRLEIAVKNCPWHALMKKSERENLSSQIAEVICKEELKVWAREYNPRIVFALAAMHCAGSPACKLVFQLVNT